MSDFPVRAAGASVALVGAPAAPVVLPANRGDLSFVVALQKANASVLGFLPRKALQQKIEQRQVLIARTAAGGRAARAGFLHHGSLARPEVRLFQIAVILGARGRGVGAALVDGLLESATAAGARGVSLRCLGFLDANRFWRAVGFRLHATEPGAKGTLNVWVKRLHPTGARDQHGQRPPGDRFAFASRVHACPCCGSPTVDTWVRGARRLSLCPGCVAAAGLN